jgi:guanylate kinase
MRTNKLIILTGPSCIGKTPLEKALTKFYPDIRNTLYKLVLFNDRAPRPGEKDGLDYHFRTTEYLKSLGNKTDYLLMDVRGDLQALYLGQLKEILLKGHAFFEGNPYIAEALLNHEKIREFPKLSLFLSPLSKEEILELKEPEKQIDLPILLSEIMRRKQLRRKTKQKTEVSLNDLDDIEKRVTSVYRELSMAWQFDYIIPNHDGEDSDNWEMFYYPVGDARKTLISFVELLKGNIPDAAEKWEEGLIEVK